MGVLCADQGVLGADEGSSGSTLLFLLEGLGIFIDLEHVPRGVSLISPKISASLDSIAVFVTASTPSSLPSWGVLGASCSWAHITDPQALPGCWLSSGVSISALGSLTSSFFRSISLPVLVPAVLRSVPLLLSPASSGSSLTPSRLCLPVC